MADELRRVVNFNFVGLFLYDEATNKVHNPLLETRNGHGFVMPPELPAEDTITWWIYHHQEPVVISSRDQERRFPRMMAVFRRYSIQSACVLPLTTAHRRLGSLGFGVEERDGYSDEEVRYLALVTDQVALAVDNALIHQEQRRGETILAAGEQLSHTGSWVWSAARDEFTWSPEQYRIFGVQPGTRSLKDVFWESVHAEDRPSVKEALSRAFRERSQFDSEFRIVRNDGSVRCLHGIGQAVLSDTGELMELVGTTMDITERKRAEGALQRQKAQFERLFELAPDAIVLRDAENRVIRANREFTTLFGYTAEESVGRDLSDLIVPDEFQDESLRMRKPIERGERIRAEVVRQHKDGTRLHVELVSAPVSAGDGEPEIYTIYRDITQRKHAEEALRRSEAYLAEGQRLSHTGSWARNVATGDLYFSQESYRIFGFDPSRTTITLDALLNRVHPDDRTSVRETISWAIREKSHFERDYRILLDNGTVRHIHVVGHPVLDSDGNAAEFVGTHMDVTEQLHSRDALEQAFEEIKALKDQLHRENVALRQEIDETSMFEEIVGKSAALRDVLAQVETVAPTESTVLICGETGTGKELIARAIHNLSARSGNAFVKLNCAAIPSGLLESELFGHERGAFTGALAQRIGRFELADRGTVFLDEVGEIPLELQPKLLRVLQEREFERLGSSQTRRTDARLIAATNRDLARMVDEQKFRADLFYRLNVFPIRVPPLRERPDDVPLLAQHFAELFSRRMRKSITSVPRETMDAMMRYHWPGNVRELQNVIERAVILSSGGVLRVAAADLTAAPGTAGAQFAPEQPTRSAKNSPPPDPQQMIQALRETGGRVGGAQGAAARVGLKRTTFIAYMKRFGINPRTVIKHF
jgi:PAS domain S-box-containing protein